ITITPSQHGGTRPGHEPVAGNGRATPGPADRLPGQPVRPSSPQHVGPAHLRADPPASGSGLVSLSPPEADVDCDLGLHPGRGPCDPDGPGPDREERLRQPRGPQSPQQLQARSDPALELAALRGAYRRLRADRVSLARLLAGLAARTNRSSCQVTIPADLHFEDSLKTRGQPCRCCKIRTSPRSDHIQPERVKSCTRILSSIWLAGLCMGVDPCTPAGAQTPAVSVDQLLRMSGP